MKFHHSNPINSANLHLLCFLQNIVIEYISNYSPGWVKLQYPVTLICGVWSLEIVP